MRALGKLPAVAALAVAAAGCGLGPGSTDTGEAELRVTRDYGRELVADASVKDPSESDTVIRMLDRETRIETRFGGGFVQSIEGLSGGVEAGRSVDWFFYVNGIESSVGSAEVPVQAGDRIWWDHRDWTDAMRVPAVVGSWPEPFAQASAGDDPDPVRMECATAAATCDEAAERLARAGADSSARPLSRAGEEPAAIRMLVGEWPRLRRDPTAALLNQGPKASGVFADFQRGPAGWRLVGLDERAEPALRGGPRSGLVAALREGEGPPTWIVAGTDRAGTAAAVAALDDADLRDRYATAVDGSDVAPLPVTGGAG